MLEDNDDRAAHNFGQLLGVGWRWLNHEAPTPEAVVNVLTAFSDVIRPGTTAIDMRERGVRVVDSTGSGKRRVHLPSVTTAATVLAGHLATKQDLPLLISKSVSGGTSYPAGSADSAQLLGVRAVESYIADQQLQPTSGFGGADILVLSGRDALGQPFIDEPSVHGATEWVTAKANGFDAGSWPGEHVTEPFPPTPPTIMDLLAGNCPEPLLRMVTRQTGIILGMGMADTQPWERWQAAARNLIGSGELAEYVSQMAHQRVGAVQGR